MSKIFTVLQARQQNYTTLRAAFRSENGAIDLASIMVGIIVIGLIGGVIAATVFAVIPWAQDNAAKQQLDSIHAAENAFYGLSSDPTANLTGGVVNSFTGSPGLETAKLLAQSATYCVVPTATGKDYTAYVKSASGKIWTAMNSAKKATVVSGTPAGECSVLDTSANNNANLPVNNNGVVTTYSAANWTTAYGLAITADRTLYGIYGMKSSINRMMADGTVSTFAGDGTQGFADGQGTAAQFYNPEGITLGPDGNLYVADYGNNRIRMATPTGVVSTVLGTGVASSVDGSVSTATVNGPTDVAFDADGNMYVSEGLGKKVRKITPAGAVTTVATLVVVASNLDVDALGNIYVVTGYRNISKINPAGVVSLLVTSESSYRGLVVEQSTGIIYATNENPTIEKIFPDGEKTILAGTAGQFGTTNGTGADARFERPYAIVITTLGELIVSSSNITTAPLRMIK